MSWEFALLNPIYRNTVATGRLGDEVTLANPGFENNLTGWTALVSTWLTGITGAITADTTAPGGGAKSAKFVLASAVGGATSAYARLTQNVTLEANTYYQFRLKHKSTANLDSKYIYLRLRASDSSLIREIVDVSGTPLDWKTLVFNFKTGAGTDWVIDLALSSIAAGTSREMWIDDVAIQKIDTLAKAEYVVAAIGDSQVSHLGLTASMENDNPKSWLSASIRKRQQTHLEVSPPLNKGTSGNQATQVAARVQADVVDASPKPAVCHVAVGTNDAAALVNLTTFKNAVTATIQTLVAGGVRPILWTIAPRRDAVDIAPYNAKIVEVAAEQGCTLFTVQPTFDAYPDWATDWMDDDIHYNQYAHVELGKDSGVYL